MEDPYVFAILAPAGRNDKARCAFRDTRNEDYLYRTEDTVQRHRSSSESNASTAASETDAADDTSVASSTENQSQAQTSFPSLDMLKLSLDHDVKSRAVGWQFGTDPNKSDIFMGLPDTKVKRQHFRISIDEELRPVLENISKRGTTVAFGEQAMDEKRTGPFRWILGDKPGVEPAFDDVRIGVPDIDGFCFNIWFPNHRAGNPEYLDRLRQFFSTSAISTCEMSQLRLTIGDPSTGKTTDHGTDDASHIYLNISDLGTGGYRTVKMAVDASRREVFAVKYFKGPKNNKNVQIWHKQIRTEAEIMQKNRHVSVQMSTSLCKEAETIAKNNLVPVVDFRVHSKPFLVMPYFSHGSLEAFRKDRKFNPQECCTILHQILQGLVHLHDLKITHRDLKPDNILVESEMPLKVRIADFGFAKKIEQSLDHSFVGTFCYIAPEVRNGRYGSAIDIWSTGVIILELWGMLDNLVGSSSDTSGSLLDQLDPRPWAEKVEDRACELSRSGKTLERFMFHMVRYNPDDRPSARQLLDDGVTKDLFRPPVERDPVERDPVERDPVERDPVERDPVEFGEEKQTAQTLNVTDEQIAQQSILGTQDPSMERFRQAKRKDESYWDQSWRGTGYYSERLPPRQRYPRKFQRKDNDESQQGNNP